MRTRVLVVDDEPDLLELIHYNLTKAGYDVACVLSGEEALTYVHSSLPDLIVLDVLLPGLDGLDVCKVLRRNPMTAGIPIVMITARSEDVDDIHIPLLLWWAIEAKLATRDIDEDGVAIVHQGDWAASCGLWR